MAASDVRLDGDHVHIDGRVVAAAATDFMLDNPGRRETDAFAREPAEFRRALVHDRGDALTINYGEDYLEVRIRGPVDVTQLRNVERVAAGDLLEVDAVVLHVAGTDIRLDDAQRRASGHERDGLRRAMIHDVGDRLSINHEGDYPGGVAIHGAVDVGGFDVGATLQRLEERVRELESRLEGGR